MVDGGRCADRYNKTNSRGSEQVAAPVGMSFVGLHKHQKHSTAPPTRRYESEAARMEADSTILKAAPSSLGGLSAL